MEEEVYKPKQYYLSESTLKKLKELMVVYDTRYEVEALRKAINVAHKVVYKVAHKQEFKQN